MKYTKQTKKLSDILLQDFFEIVKINGFCQKAIKKSPKSFDNRFKLSYVGL